MSSTEGRGAHKWRTCNQSLQLRILSTRSRLCDTDAVRVPPCLPLLNLPRSFVVETTTRAAYVASEAKCTDALVEDGDLNGENAADGEGDAAEAVDRVKCEYDSRTRLAIACDGPTLRGIQSPLLLLRNSVIRALSDSLTLFDFAVSQEILPTRFWS